MRAGADSAAARNAAPSPLGQFPGMAELGTVLSKGKAPKIHGFRITSRTGSRGFATQNCVPSFFLRLGRGTATCCRSDHVWKADSGHSSGAPRKHVEGGAATWPLMALGKVGFVMSSPRAAVV